MDHAEPGAGGGHQGRQAGGFKALFDRVNDHRGQEHRRDDLPLLQGKGAGGPDIGLLQSLQQPGAEGGVWTAGSAGPQPRLNQQCPPSRQTGHQA